MRETAHVRVFAFRMPVDHLLDDAESSTVTLDQLKNLDNDKEFWLIRAPRDIDMKCLSGRTIILGGPEQSLSSGEKKYKVLLSQANSESSKVVLPTNSPGKLSCGPHMSGEMIIQQAVDISEIQIPPTIKTDKKISHPAGLKSRWKPFGWKSPYIRKSVKHKHKSRKGKEVK